MQVTLELRDAECLTFRILEASQCDEVALALQVLTKAPQVLAKAPQVSALGDFVLIPENWHRRLAQRMVLLRGAPPAARAFYDYVATPAAQDTMRRHGFAMPGE